MRIQLNRESEVRELVGGESEGEGGDKAREERRRACELMRWMIRMLLLPEMLFHSRHLLWRELRSCWGILRRPF